MTRRWWAAVRVVTATVFAMATGLGLVASPPAVPTVSTAEAYTLYPIKRPRLAEVGSQSWSAIYVDWSGLTDTPAEQGATLTAGQWREELRAAMSAWNSGISDAGARFWLQPWSGVSTSPRPVPVPDVVVKTVDVSAVPASAVPTWRLTDGTPYTLAPNMQTEYPLSTQAIAVPMQCDASGRNCLAVQVSANGKVSLPQGMKEITHTVIAMSALNHPSSTFRWDVHDVPKTGRGLDPQTALGHELGHALGLDHSAAPTAYGTKCPQLYMVGDVCRPADGSPIPAGQWVVRKGNLSYDDRCGVRELYSIPRTKCPSRSDKWGDADGDCDVDIFDYNTVIRAMNTPSTTPAPGPGPVPMIPGDLDGNGVVNVFDYNIVVRDMGKNCLTWGR